MLYDLEPAKEVLGFSWARGGEHDELMLNTLKKVIMTYLARDENKVRQLLLSRDSSSRALCNQTETRQPRANHRVHLEAGSHLS